MNVDQQTTRLLSRALLSCATVLSHTKDSYLTRSLEDAILACVESGVRSKDAQDASRSTAELQRCLEEVSQSQEVPLRVQLFAERHVLQLLLHLRSRPLNDKAEPVTPLARTRPTVPQQSHEDGNGMANGRVTDTMKLVLEGIKKTQPARAKDVIGVCESLSQRTVKRNLSELVRSGLVNKNARNGAVLYSVSGPV